VELHMDFQLVVVVDNPLVAVTDDKKAVVHCIRLLVVLLVSLPILLLEKAKIRKTKGIIQSTYFVVVDDV
jgi:hypothetical protein